LWRRAVYATIPAVAMAVIYPPAWLGGVAPSRDRPALVPSAQAPSAMARSEPSPVVQAADPGRVVASGPVLAGAQFSDALPLGPQSIPLPPGRCTVLAVSAGAPSSGPPIVNAFLALIVGGRVAAAVVAGGSTEPDPKQAGFPALLEVQALPVYYRRVLSAIDHGTVDLWLCGRDQPSLWKEPLRRAALGVIREQDLMFPDHLDTVAFRLSDKRNLVAADFMFPDPAGAADPVRPWTDVAELSDAAPLSHLEKVRRWGKAWHDIMRRSFAGQMKPGEETHIPLP